jgi:hypothetical protein
MLWFFWLALLEGSHLNCFGSTIIYLRTADSPRTLDYRQALWRVQE